MKLFENGVGRPSNEVKKKRKIFIASIVVAVVAVISLGCFMIFSKVDVLNLKGESYNGTTIINASAKNKYVKVSNCKATIPITIKNKKKWKITITDLFLTYYDYPEYKGYLAHKSLTPSDPRNNLDKDSSNDYYITVDLDKMEALGRYTIVIYFNGKHGRKYWKKETYTASYSPAIKQNEIIACRNKKNTPTTTKVTTQKPTPTTKATTKKPSTTKRRTTTRRKVQQTKATTQRRTKVVNTGNLTLDCPSQAVVGETFFCYTNYVGATIVIPKQNLSSKLRTSFKTISKDRKKKLNYTKPGKITVEVRTASGQKVTKVVEIVQKENLTLNCPSSVYVGEEVVCYTNVEGTKIAISSSSATRAKGYASSVTVSELNKWKGYKFAKKGTVKVKASKKGYNSVIKTITVK